MSLVANHSYDLHARSWRPAVNATLLSSLCSRKGALRQVTPAVFLVSRPPSPLEFHCNFCLCVAMNSGEPSRERALGRRSILRSTLAPLLGSPSIILAKNVLKLPPPYCDTIDSTPHEASILRFGLVRKDVVRRRRDAAARRGRRRRTRARARARARAPSNTYTPRRLRGCREGVPYIRCSSLASRRLQQQWRPRQAQQTCTGPMPRH